MAGQTKKCSLARQKDKNPIATSRYPTSQDGVFQTLLSKLPLADVDDDAWECFLQSEKTNDLVEPLIILNYTTHTTSGCADLSNHSVTGSRDAVFISKIFEELANALHAGDCVQLDATFWKELRCVSSSIPLSAPQALLLLVVQCIFDGDTATAALSASKLFLLLCQLPQATENFFGPNMFIIRRILLPLNSNVASTLEDDGQSSTAPTGTLVSQNDLNAFRLLCCPALGGPRMVVSDDEESPNNAHGTSRFPLGFLRSTVIIAATFLKSACKTLLSSELGRTVIATVAELLCEAALKWTSDDLSLLAKEGLIEYMISLERSTLADAAEGSSNSADTIGGRCLVPLVCGGPRGDPLLFGCATFMRTITAALSGRRTAGKQGTHERRRAIEILSDLLERIPMLLNPSELKLDVEQTDHTIGMNDDEEDQGPPVQAPRHLKTESDATQKMLHIIASDDDTGLPSDDDNDDDLPPRCENGVTVRKKQQGRRSKRKLALMKQQAEATSNDPLLAVLARCCLLSPDRKEAREAIAAAIKTLLELAAAQEMKTIQQCREQSLRERFSAFLMQLSVSNRSTWRLLAIEIITACILEVDLQSTPEARLPLAITLRLLHSIITRVRDMQPSVRTRAVECLASLITSATRTCRLSSSHEGLHAVLLSGTFAPADRPAIHLRAIIHDVVLDEKQLPRRAVLSLIKSIAEAVHADVVHKTSEHTTGPTSVIETLTSLGVFDSDVFPRLATDPGILVRSKVVATLSDMFQLFPDVVPIQRLWLSTVPAAAVCDAEKTVAERSVEAVGAVLFRSQWALSDVHHAAENCTVSPGALGLLSIATHEEVEYIQRCVALLYKRDGGLPSEFLKALRDVCQSFCLKNPQLRWPVGCFQLVQEIISHQKKAIPSHVLCQCWFMAMQRITSGIYSEESTTIAHCLLIAFRHLEQNTLEASDQLALETTITSTLKTFTSPLNLLTPLIMCLHHVVSLRKDKTLMRVLTQDVMQYIPTLVPSATTNVITQPEFSTASFSDDQRRCALLTLGDLVALTECPVPPTVTTCLHALVLGDGAREKERVHVSIRAAALLALGKICMAHESLAKKLLPFFASQLVESAPNIIRCNALVVFADCCVRYASLTDRFLPQFTGCLGAPCALLRKQSLALTAGLLAQDYLKCKGLVLYRLLTLLGDSNACVRRLAEVVVLHVIMPKHANFVQNHFIETVCFCCGLAHHPIFKPSIVGGWSYLKPSSPFCLLRHPKRREVIYRFFLRHMTDRDRHELSRRLVHSFLTAFVDGDEYSGRRLLDLPKTAEEPAGAALRDALKLLGCKQMKITFDKQRSSGGRSGVDDEDTVPAETDEGQEKQAAYEVNLLKRNLAYQILPTLLSLKRVMEDACSPFLRDILQCLSALLFDYRNELSEIIFHDPMLAKQLDLDFKRNAPFRDDHSVSGRPSLFLEPVISPRITASAAVTMVASGVVPSTFLRQRRGSIYTGSSHATMTLPRLRAEVATSNRRQTMGPETKQTLRSTPVATIPFEETLEQDPSDSKVLLRTPSHRALARNEDERLEQESILTALRSGRRRHSLPPVHDPVYEEQLELLTGRQGSADATHKPSSPSLFSNVSEDDTSVPSDGAHDESYHPTSPTEKENVDIVKTQQDPSEDSPTESQESKGSAPRRVKKRLKSSLNARRRSRLQW